MKNNIKTIAIIDDNPENLKAATTAVSEFLPNTTIFTFNSATDFFNEIGSERPRFDFVISDMNMEERHSGFKVACLCWSWMVPTVIVSGGFTHGKTAVSIGFIGTSIFGSKDDVGVWKEVLKAIFSGGEENPIILSLMVGKNSRQCEAFGEIGGYSFAKHCR